MKKQVYKLTILLVSIAIIYSCNNTTNRKEDIKSKTEKENIVNENQNLDNEPATALHSPDNEFLEEAAKIGITQENWDNGASAKLTMQNAYRFTYSVEMQKGSYVHDLGKPTGLDLSKLTGFDVDGEHPLDIIIRDRLNTESLVILKNGKLVDEYYWNGMHKNHTHLQMSVTKSFTSLTLQTLVAEGKVDMNKPITDYLPELKASVGFSRATVQEVADMRSGINVPFSPGKLWDDRMTNVQEWNGKNEYPELKSVLDYAKIVEKRDDYKKGELYDYLDANTEMMGMVVARVTGKPLTQVMEERLWSKVGFEHNARLMSNSDGEAVASGGLNATTRDVARMMDVLVNNGKNRVGEQVISKEFIKSLLDGNKDVKLAWKNGKESKMVKDGWYKDQIRAFNIEGHKFLAFVGIHGQVAIGEPSTGVVIAMNGAQDQKQAVRTVSMTFLNVFPTLLDATVTTK